MPQPVSNRSKLFNRLGSILFMISSLFILGFMLFVLISEGNTSFSFSMGFMLLVAIGGLVLSIFGWNLKTEETELEKALSKRESQAFFRALWKRWYIRYLYAFFMFAVAYIILYVINEGIRPHGLGIFFFNPIVMWLCVALAVFSAWELSLCALVLGLLLLLFKVLTLLPTNIIIVFGVLVVALIIWKFNKR